MVPPFKRDLLCRRQLCPPISQSEFAAESEREKNIYSSFVAALKLGAFGSAGQICTPERIIATSSCLCAKARRTKSASAADCGAKYMESPCTLIRIPAFFKSLTKRVKDFLVIVDVHSRKQKM
jgi:hypothetical protein